jgi:hypothetical protein
MLSLYGRAYPGLWCDYTITITKSNPAVRNPYRCIRRKLIKRGESTPRDEAVRIALAGPVPTPNAGLRAVMRLCQLVSDQQGKAPAAF